MEKNVKRVSVYKADVDPKLIRDLIQRSDFLGSLHF